MTISAKYLTETPTGVTENKSVSEGVRHGMDRTAGSWDLRQIMQ